MTARKLFRENVERIAIVGSPLKRVRLTVGCGRPHWTPERCDLGSLSSVWMLCRRSVSEGDRSFLMVYIYSQPQLLHQCFLHLHATKSIIHKYYGIPCPGQSPQGTILKEMYKALGYLHAFLRGCKKSGHEQGHSVSARKSNCG